MLKELCQRFRDSFEPGRDDPHREACADCRAWAELFAGAVPKRDPQPLPPALRRRLVAIPRREVVCRDVDRLYTATRRAATSRTADPAVREHLGRCRHCRQIYDTLRAALTPAPRPTPKRLVRRLRAIARQAVYLPEWVRDVRYGAAACYLLTALTLAAAGDASALFRETTETVSSSTSVWVREGENRGTQAWDRLAAGVGRGLDRGKETLETYRASGQRLLADAYRWIEIKKNELTSTRGLDSEGES